MLSYKSDKSRLLERLFDEGQDVEAHFTVLEDEHGCHGEHHRTHTTHIVEEHAGDLYQKEAVADQHLHVIDGAVWDILRDHVQEVVKIAKRIVIRVQLSHAEVEPGEEGPCSRHYHEKCQICVLEDDL